MKILITTGVYPPKIGGPAQYAKNMVKEKYDWDLIAKEMKSKVFESI